MIKCGCPDTYSGQPVLFTLKSLFFRKITTIFGHLKSAIIMRNLYLSILLLLCALQASFAQDPALDYLVAAGNQAVIYHGKEQLKYPTTIHGHPYLGSEDYAAGELTFEGILYKDVNLRLDVYRNELMLLTKDRRFNIIISADRVNHACFRGYHVYYHYPDTLRGTPPEGYYLRLYDGGVTVLEKQVCTLFRTVEDMEIKDLFVRSVKFYVLKEMVYYTVGSKRSVLRLFKDRKSELARFIRQRHLDFKRMPEQAIVEVVKEFERLNAKP